MKILFSIFLIVIILSFLPGCFFYKKNLTPSKEKPECVTVSVHGTLAARSLVKSLDSPEGLCPLEDRPNAFVLSRMGHVLHEADPNMFPFETFYLYGWSGKLNFNEREMAAEKLYHDLKNITGKITLIGHSHGGNVIFNLAKVAQNHNDKDFKIYKLVLLATPVQEVYANYFKSPIFENIVSLYSNTDVIQILDPQGLYKESKELKKNGTKIPIFSNRLLPNNPKIKQVRVLINKSNPGHIDFIRPKFLTALPEILKKVESSSENNFIINIDRRGKPVFVKLLKRKDGRRVYVPL